MSKLKKSKHLTIPLKEIEIATNNFDTCIGKGGYGLVYKGELEIFGKLTTVAVKRLFKQHGQGSKEFLTEISLLSGQNHPNLVSLLGYCDEGKEKILVYEYIERGSLDRYISHHDRTHSLPWRKRLEICLDIARGLDHLHNHYGKHQAIIHRDIKSANILIDHNWVAKISDLGLSKLSLAGLDRSAYITQACGTLGYLEPEYITTGIVTKKSDVYSFGVVLLEILCGRLCNEDGLRLTSYSEKKKLDEIIDPTLRLQMSSHSMSVDNLLKIAYGCLDEDREQRFPIDFVVKGLEDLLKTQSDGSPNCSFATLLRRRTNVGKIFDLFDFNRDGGLSREELIAFLLATNVNIEQGPEQFRDVVDEIFCLYDKYLDDKRGLTYHGLLQYYEDGHGDSESDVLKLVSDSYSDDDDSSRRQRLMTNFQKRNPGAYDGPLKLAPDSKPHDIDEATPWFGSPDSLVMIKSLTIKPTLLLLGIVLYILLILLISMSPTILAKLRLLWFVYLILLNSIAAFRKQMEEHA